jgi:2'-5' RNA ligase
VRVHSARIVVALLFDPETSKSLDELRVAWGERRPERIPSHITLVAPVDLDVAKLPAVEEELSEAARQTPGPIELELGPGATFAPRVRTIHLAVRGVGQQDGASLAQLREAVRLPRLAELDRRPFHPHVTLTVRAPQQRIEAALVALADVRLRCQIDQVTLLRHHAGPPTRWVAAFDAPLGRDGA